MPPTITTALAPTFTHTASIGDVVVQWASGPSPSTTILPTGSYRMALAPTSGTVKDYLRALASAMQSAIQTTRSSTSYTVTCTINAAGIVTLELNSGAALAPSSITLASSVWQRLGMSSATPFVTVVKYSTAVGVRPPWHLATFVERVSNDWTQRTPISAAETIAGIGYGVTSGTPTWSDEIAFGFVPRDPTFRASLGLYQTAWFPADSYLAAPGIVAAREYSVSDLLTESLGQTVAYANGTFQTIRAGTTSTVDLVTIPGGEISAPRVVRLRQGWDAYRRWTSRLIRQSTPTGSTT